MAAPAVRVRVFAAVRRLERDRPEGGEEVHRHAVPRQAARPLRLGGPARARLPQDDPAPHLRQVHAVPRLHSQVDQQHLLPLHLRDRAPQRHRRAVGDPRLDHQWLRAAAEGRAQAVPDARAAPLAQGAVRRDVPPAALVLRHPVRREGPEAREAGAREHPRLLAADVLAEGGALPQRGRGDPRDGAGARVHHHHEAALLAHRALRRLAALPGRRARAVPVEQRVHRLAHRAEPRGDPADRLRGALRQLAQALELDGPRAHVQRRQALHGDGRPALRPVLRRLPRPAGEDFQSAGARPASILCGHRAGCDTARDAWRGPAAPRPGCADIGAHGSESSSGEADVEVRRGRRRPGTDQHYAHLPLYPVLHELKRPLDRTGRRRQLDRRAV